MEADSRKQRSRFPPLFWLVVVFEFFERGSYYGMMSVYSVYLTDILGFPKEDVGLIKGTIQPLLYFLPIISGALADRFGYRRTLMVAFALLGGGYFLTAQATDYALVFASLVVMGLGAGTFKPVISGTIARCTDESNSTLGFGIFYWSINLGAFLFPLFLVPFLKKNVGWDWVIIASAIGTGAMLIPTFLWYREPPKPAEVDKAGKANLLQTLANAFEIIYSPLVLMGAWMARSALGIVVASLLLLGLLGYGGFRFMMPSGASFTFSMYAADTGNGRLLVKVSRNLCSGKAYELKVDEEDGTGRLTIQDPDRLEESVDRLLAEFDRLEGLSGVGRVRLLSYAAGALERTKLTVVIDSVIIKEDPLQATVWPPYLLEKTPDGEHQYLLTISDINRFESLKSDIMDELARTSPQLAALSDAEVERLVRRADEHPFLVLFVGILLLAGLVAMRLAGAFQRAGRTTRTVYLLVTVGVLELVLWCLPGISMFGRVVSGVISLTVLSLYAIDYSELARFRDHLRFLVMIFIYAGFWVLYFQMFDSVLWYVQGYVDASSLNDAVNSVLTAVGLKGDWRFDVEHVTVINAGTIILLQLAISNVVKNTRALPTMVVGIGFGTIGMAILAISTGIWVFMLGTVIFSIGEMTAHPKFISYVGQTAPKSRVAMYMGYLFLYGVIGSSIGGVVGANLYVKFVDEMDQPRTLWLIFTGIGLATIVGLLLYNRFLVKKEP